MLEPSGVGLVSHMRRLATAGARTALPRAPLRVGRFATLASP